MRDARWRTCILLSRIRANRRSAVSSTRQPLSFTTDTVRDPRDLLSSASQELQQQKTSGLARKRNIPAFLKLSDTSTASLAPGLRVRQEGERRFLHLIGARSENIGQSADPMLTRDFPVIRIPCVCAFDERKRWYVAESRDATWEA